MADNIARALTDAAVRNAKPNDKPYKMTDGGGLYLLVQPTGAKLWRYKFRVLGKEGLHSIGGYPDVSLTAARIDHRAARSNVAAGINPVHDRQAARDQEIQLQLRAEQGAFAMVVAGWRAKSDPNLSANSIKQKTREIDKYLMPEFKGKTIQNIHRRDVAPLLRRVEMKAPEVSRNLRTYLWQIFEFAIDCGLVDANPVPSSRMLKPRSKQQHAAMSIATLPLFLAAMDASGATILTRSAMMLVILSACRKNEVCAARWSEFDLDASEWTIPAERMKARREHWVPLSKPAVALLRDLRAVSDGEYLFPHRDRENTPMADRTLNALIERTGFSGETVHGFRSVFSTHFNELGANPDVIERCLAHQPKDKIRAAYNRHQYRDERRAMMQQWADYVCSMNYSNNQSRAARIAA